ncbi:MAG: hypothetical protein J6Z35_11555, partial [Lachnospiraceae bacterium]|nr:hypothetical protein [Lachnospiraceae bacterium]
ILAEREEELGDVCRDLRISYMLKERYEIMLGRLKYIYEHNYIDEDTYNRLSLMISDLIDSSQRLMNLAIKGQLRRVEPYRISKQLMGIYTKEEDFCKNFLQVFKQS